ncbi:MAG TPA: Npt1/Npt2 family nucleotide transporter [Candidatus Binatia bacterium]|jgi:AAA family ATP:ADP antiporter|nr:Npt1/Npt2 family nucleotide transporter [Candidatus Binatia bacterium]
MDTGRGLGAFGAVRREEWPFALCMFTNIFLVIATFWILKPLKKALFIQQYDQSGVLLLGHQFAAAEAELLAKVLNMLVAAVAVTVFTWLARRLRRERLTAALMAFFIAADLVFAWLLVQPGPLTVWGFYLFGDLFSTLMVAAFFAFLNDSVTPDAAKRLYGFVGLGAVLGGVVGSSALGALVGAFAAPVWALVCAAIGVVVVVVAWTAARMAVDTPAVADATPAPAHSAALEGAALVLRSPYLLSIAAIVALYEVVSTVMDFQFTSAVSHYLDGAAIARHLSVVFAITNVASMLVQLFVTSTLMQTWGVGAALLVLPFTAGLGSLAFLAWPGLWVGSLLNTADNAFSYSVNQSAKEALYVPTSADEKYKAKAFIDMFVQRAAKTVGVGLSLAMGAWFHSYASVRWLSVVTIGLVVVWGVAARYAGRRFADETT